MIKKILVIALVIFTSISYAQEGTRSPYSFYGIGTQKFRGTVENRSMGGLGILTDSIHLNLRNPAAFGGLKLTNYSLGISYNNFTLENDTQRENAKAATLDYLAIGIPAGKFGFGFGVLPFSAVGYKLESDEAGNNSRFTGTGGLNKVFLAAGYDINDKLSVGLDFNYNFGNIQNKVILLQDDIQFGSRDLRSSNLSGFSFSLGLTYKTMITDRLMLSTSVVSTPTTKLTSENTRELATILLGPRGQELISENQNISLEDTEFKLPAEFRFGTGIGEPKKWFVGGEYTYLQASENSEINVNITTDNVEYQDVSKFNMGGYYIPKYNSLTNYFSRVVYRGGFRYEETGLLVNEVSINEFGISFGVGLPMGNLFSNLNLGFEYGQRGTTTAGLIKEEFFNISLSLSLNDKWFKELKFN